MRRVSRILTLILIVVMLFGVFAGCDLIGKDTGKYRAATAITIGNQKITVGKLLDTFNSYYNQYYFYVYYSGWTVEDIFDLAVQSLYTQYMKVEKYTGNAANKVSPAPQNASDFTYAEFLTQDQLDYSISYVKYLFLTSFDTSVTDKVEAKYTLKDEEKEDTSRDFYKYDELDLAEGENYANYNLKKNFKNEEMDEYIEKYYGGDKSGFISHDTSLEALQKLYLASASKKLEGLNARLDMEDEDATITLEEYEGYQKAVITQYQTTVKNNYGLDFQVFFKSQIDDMLISAIVNLYNYQVYKNIEADNNGEMMKTLKGNYDTLVAEQKAKFDNDGNKFNTFIEGLSDSSFIYYVPETRSTDYVFVKNILVPFKAAQTAKLTSLKADLGTAKDSRYTNLRNKLASQIVADDFYSEKDEDGKYATQVKDMFKVVEDKVVINPECTALSDYLKADGSVTAMDGKSVDETIQELMGQFNTDVAQHASLYSYVVRVGKKVEDGGNIPNSYTHKWVQEFVDATNDALAAAKEAGKDDPAGYYGIGVSDYGVHIVYVQGYVKADLVDFSADVNYLDTTTNAYRLFKNYFETQSNLLLSQNLKELKESYKSQVKPTDVFKKFLKENGLEYDLVAKLNEA